MTYLVTAGHPADTTATVEHDSITETILDAILVAKNGEPFTISYR